MSSVKFSKLISIVRLHAKSILSKGACSTFFYFWMLKFQVYSIAPTVENLEKLIILS